MIFYSDGQRIEKRFATWYQARQAVQIMRQEGNTAGARKLKREMKLLRPYWDRPGVTKEQAVAAFYVDYPDAPGAPGTSEFEVILAGLYTLDDQRYMPVEFARWEHAVQALAFLKEDDPDHHAHLAREMELLKPYWDRPGVTKEQAVATYNADHPDARLSIYPAKRKGGK
jgi:hypothetical protein